MKSTALICSVIVAFAMVTVANAQTTSLVTFTVGTDFDGQFFNGPGDPLNETGTFAFNPGDVITGYSFDVVSTTADPAQASWGNEQDFTFGSTADPTAVTFTASATGAPVFGEANSSGGVIGITPITLTDGLLAYELSESFDDDPGLDGIWEVGSTVSFEVTSTAIPEPASLGLLSLMGIAAVSRRRR